MRLFLEAQHGAVIISESLHGDEKREKGMHSSHAVTLYCWGEPLLYFDRDTDQKKECSCGPEETETFYNMSFV